MSMRNKFIKGLGYLGICLLVLLESYFTSVLVTGTLLSITCAIWSCFYTLPEILCVNYGMVFLSLSVPLSLIFFIYICAKSKESK